MTAPLADFRIVRPDTVEAALAARRGQAASRFIAGGTDLIVNFRRGVGQPELLVDLAGVEELRGLSCAPTGRRIGAAVTLAALAASPDVRARYPAVAQAAAAIAGPSHRSVATVGGNLCLDTRCIYYNQSEWWRRSNHFCLKHDGETCHVAPQGVRCHAAFSGDLAPALMVVGAELDIASPAGRRRMPLADLYNEDGRAHLRLAAEELIVAVHLPAMAPPSAYEKVRVRGSIDFPLAGVAVALAASGGALSALKIALTGTNSRPFLLDGTDAFLGKALDERALGQIDKLVQKQVQPMRTTLASANYRRLAAAALARRLSARLFEQAGS